MNILVLRNLSLKPGHVLFFQGAVAALLYLLIYAPLLPGLVRDWYEHDNFSYGFLIPFIFIYLLWQKREILRNTPVSASSWGALSLLAAVVIGLTGKVMGDSFTLRLSMILALGGLAHLLLGKHQIKVLLFPLAYLLLMVPPPYLVVKEISYYLRFFDAVLATSALQAMGIPVYQDSYFLHLPNITLEVADICSGISSLFAMVAAGVFYINSLPVRPSSKAVIMVGALLFPVLANLFRIVLISAIVYYFGPAILQSFFHQFTGTFTFLLSIVVLVVLGEYLRRKSPRIASATSLHQSNGIGADGLRASGHPHPPARLLSRAFLSALAILALAWYLGNSLETRQPIALRKDLQELPVQFGAHFLAANGNWSDSYQDPNAETAVSRIYEGPGKEPVELYVGYRSSQHDRARLLSPKMHFPDGWNYVSIHPAQIEISGAEPIKANWMVIQKNEARRLVLYWYQARGRSFSGEISNHFVQVRSLIQDGRTEGAVVRITTPVWGDENLKQAQERIRDFSGHVYLELAEILPDSQQSGQHRQLPE